jgi:hypothetical protein
MQSLKKLRSWRVRPDRDATIGKQVASALREAAAVQRRSDGAATAWVAAAPAKFRGQCEVTTKGGVLTIRPGSAAVRFQIDRWLRSGGEAALRSGGVARIKLV